MAPDDASSCAGATASRLARGVLRTARPAARDGDVPSRLDHLPRAAGASIGGTDSVISVEQPDKLAVRGGDGRAAEVVVVHIVSHLPDRNVRSKCARTFRHLVLTATQQTEHDTVLIDDHRVDRSDHGDVREPRGGDVLPADGPRAGPGRVFPFPPAPRPKASPACLPDTPARHPLPGS